MNNYKYHLGPYDKQSIFVSDNPENIISNSFIINSSSRNWNMYPPESYTLELNTNYRYVHSIELIDGYVPSSGYNISKYNNYFKFEIGSEVYQLYIDEGYYDIIKLLNTLEKNMSDISGTKFKCYENNITRKITIESEHCFDLIFTDRDEIVGTNGKSETLIINKVGKKEKMNIQTGNKKNTYISNSIGKILGFKPQNLYGLKKYTGQMIYNLKPFDYLGLYVGTSTSGDFSNVDVPLCNSNSDGPFAVLWLNSTNESFDLTRINQRITMNIKYKRYFNPPINIDKIIIEFKTPDGLLYNFNGQEHYLIFEVKQLFENNKIVTNRQVVY